MPTASGLGDVRTTRPKENPRVVDIPSEEATAACRCSRTLNLLGCLVLIGTAFGVGVWSAMSVR